MGRWLLGLSSFAFLVAAGAARTAELTVQQSRIQARGSGGSLIADGAYIATASDCAACHSTPGQGSYAGGLAINSPIGTIYSSNITPSRRFGIGLYTRDQFAMALRRGIRRDGARLYPAMPYTAYARLSDHDIDALYAYFMTAVAPIEKAAPVTRLPFPANLRIAMAGWNLLFAGASPYVRDPGRSNAWNRGRYLVEGAAHCSTCHTPRGVLMQERTGRALTGGQVGAWYAPNITADPVDGIGTWSKAELATYLEIGINRRHGARAAGPMGEAVEKSFSKLSDADRDAIATYILDQPVDKGRTAASRFDRGGPATTVATSRGLPVDGSMVGDRGALLFRERCATCHGDAGRGSQDGYFPALFHDSATGADNSNLVATILNGVDRTTAVGQAFMPAFSGKSTHPEQMSDIDLALVANHVRHQYGVTGSDVDAAYVATIRTGGPRSPLILVVRIAMALMLAVSAALVVLLVRHRRRKRR